MSRREVPAGPGGHPVTAARHQETYRQQVRDYAAALDWVSGLITTTEPEMLSRPTPCAEWDVRALIGHLIGTAHRGRATATAIPAGVPHVVTDVPDDELGPAYARLAAEIVPAFAALAGDSRVRAPWGEVPALAAVRGFTIETTAHGWDLAIATGRPADAPPGVAERCLECAADVVPARLRGVMYAAPIVATSEAAPTERLARLLGRH